MVFTDELKQLINADDTQKKVILSFPNSDIEDITNSQIYSESMSLEESLIEQSDIKFGKCNASVFKIRVANIDANLEGLDLSVSITFSNASLGLEQNIPIGVYKIRTAERSADRKWKDIVAYDYMTKFDVDIADWYNTVAFPTDDAKVLCKTLIAMLCDYVGVSYDTNYNFTFGDLAISKNILPTSLSGRDFLQQLLEFNCCFGHFNELGVLSFIDIEYDYAEYVYPSDDIFPSDDFLGGIQGMRADEVISLYKSCNFEEYQVIQPDSVAIKMEDDSIGVVVGSELGDRTYRVIGNSCLYGLSANELRTVATTMLNRLEQFYYTPNVTEVKGGLFLTLGSAYQVTHKLGNFQSYVLRRTIKGIQALYSTLESNAVEYATETSNIITEMSVIKGKTAKVKRDIDSLTVEYQDFTEHTRTQFEQSAEQFSWLVADNFSESNVLLSADAYTAIANNIVLQGNHIILDGDTTVTEGFTLSADNLDVNSIFAEDITATGTITGATLIGGSLKSMADDGSYCEIIKGNIRSYDASSKATMNYSKASLDITEQGNYSVLVGKKGFIIGTGNVSGAYDIYYYPLLRSNILFNMGIQTTSLCTKDTVVYWQDNYDDYPYEGAIACANWFRSYGQTGWYNETYGVGIYAIDNWVRTYNSIGFASSGTICSYGIGRYGQFEAEYGNTSFIMRNDGTNFYILPGTNGSGWTATTWYMDTNGRTFMTNGFIARTNTYMMSLSSDQFLRCYDSSLNSCDGVMRVGSPNYRMGQIYSTNAAILTSDRKRKKNINQLEEKHIQFIRKVVPVSFEFIEGTSGRTHIGFIAQDIEEAMNECGLSDLDFAGFCKDKKRICHENADGTQWYEDVLDKDGNQIYIYSLRYEEFIALNTKAIQYCMDRLDKIEELLLGGNENA